MNKLLKVHFSLFTVMLIYAYTFTFVKDVIPEYIGAFGFIGYRVLTALILFLGFSIFWVKERVEKKDIKKLVIASIFGVAANMLMFFKGLEYTTPIRGAVLMLCTPIFVVVFRYIIYKEKLKLTTIVGIIVACFGALMLIGGKNFRFVGNTVKGDVLIILNAISYAFYLVYIGDLLKKYKAITINTYTFFFGFLFVIPFAFNEALAVNPAVIPADIWYRIVFILVLSSFVTYLLNAYAIRLADPIIAGSYIYLQPLLATLVAIQFNSDVITFHKVLYGLVIILGLFLVNIRYVGIKINDRLRKPKSEAQ